MQEVSYREVANLIAEKSGDGGVFLSAGEGEHANTMTIGWGNVSNMYAKGAFFALVRASRRTYGLVQSGRCYTVSVPLHDMRKELAFAGTKSGFHVNKFEGHGLTAAPAQTVAAPIVAECELHVECKVIGAVPITPEELDAAVLDRWYPSRDMHTLFLGEIQRCYYTDR